MKRLLLLRHGQAVHNPRAEAAHAAGCSFESFLAIMKEDDALDAPLTPLGRCQAAAACEAVEGGSAALGLELLVASSLSRAIETASLAFPEAACAGKSRFLALESLRERNGWMINAKRRLRSELAVQFPNCSFEHLPSEEDGEWTSELEDEDACAERGYQALLWLMNRPESTIGVVAHGGIFKLAFTTHPKIFADKAIAARFGNAELKVYRTQKLQHVWKSVLCLRGSLTEYCTRLCGRLPHAHGQHAIGLDSFDYAAKCISPLKLWTPLRHAQCVGLTRALAPSS